ncbi:hypothetical protein TIFTF001_012242 [Ficus carica]|uniref:Uncharacterized protein n=1 Tax=Ficus carica TaxID=3494 RepID=A0AA88ABY4_FICCA|nr:hypothetical protein TIFTF001_012242 [Ficus carica]
MHNAAGRWAPSPHEATNRLAISPLTPLARATPSSCDVVGRSSVSLPLLRPPSFSQCWIYPFLQDTESRRSKATIAKSDH